MPRLDFLFSRNFFWLFCSDTLVGLVFFPVVELKVCEDIAVSI